MILDAFQHHLPVIKICQRKLLIFNTSSVNSTLVIIFVVIMFKFNFQVETTEPGVSRIRKDPDETEDTVPKDLTQKNECYEAEKIDAEKRHIEILDVYRASSTEVNYGSTEISYLLANCIKDILNETADVIIKADCSDSDLISGVYEGGAKIWECTEDLLQYMASHLKLNSLKNKRVLDLGCGAGLLGLYAMRSEANVEFQDYNKDVLQNITIPNVLLNLPESENIIDKIKQISFYSGDWEKYAEKTIGDEKFDVIFTSETIYNPSNYEKLVNCFKRKLKKDGVVYLAAKVYYFGVGGGLRDFEVYIEKDGVFRSTVVSQTTCDVHREILEIKFNDIKRNKR